MKRGILASILGMVFPLGLMRTYADEPGGGGPAATPPAPAPAQTFSAEYVRELREENKAWRLKHDTAAQEVGTHKTAAEKAATKADAKIAAATTAANERVIR